MVKHLTKRNRPTLNKIDLRKRSLMCVCTDLVKWNVRTGSGKCNLSRTIIIHVM